LQSLLRSLVLTAVMVLTVHGLAFAQKVKIGYWTSGFSLGFGAVMEQMRFAEQDGLDVEWVKFAEVNGPTRAIVSHGIDIAFAAPSTAAMQIAGDGVPIKIVLATQILEGQIVVLPNSPIKSVSELKGRKIGMSPPGSATHAITSSILENNFGLKSADYNVVPGNEGRLAQFLVQKDTDAAAIRSVTIAQIEEVKPRSLASIVDEWKKLTKSSAVPILAVTIVHDDYLAKQPQAVAQFIASVKKALEFGAKNHQRVAEILQKSANMKPEDALAYARQWEGAYMASFEPSDIASLKRLHQIAKAAGAVKKDPPDSAFVTEPYERSKKLK
jgi:NitT/TauT family transport system substrate-binding protein